MAEYILGLLLVAQSSRDRHVFRYPPDPTSPSDRLSQPIYSRATYTAQDNTVDRQGNPARLFARRGEGSRGSATSRGVSDRDRDRERRGTTPGLSGFSGGYSGGLSRRSEDSLPGTGRSGRSGSLHSHMTEYGSEAGSTSSSSDDSDIDGLWGGGFGHSNNHSSTHPQLSHSLSHTHSPHHSHQHSNGSGNPRRFSSETDASRGSGGALLGHSVTSAVKGFTEITPANLDRRGSLAESEGTSKPRKHGPTTLDVQYNYSLGYPLDFLSDLLSPPRTACNRKFEIGVNELIFIGHPVCAGPDGKWTLPTEDSDSEDERQARRVSRGRRLEARDVSLRSVAEHPESRVGSALPSPSVNGGDNPMNGHTGSSTEVSSGTETPVSAAATRGMSASTVLKKPDEAELSMFHLVLILDKPDPKPDQLFSDCVDILYREVAFKWAAAAFALQVKDNWVGREVKKLMAIREKAMSDGIPVNECLRSCIDQTEVGASLHELYAALHKIKSRPLNGHFSHVSTTVKVPVGSIPITLVVPPRSHDVEAIMALEDSDSDSDSDEWDFAGPDGALIAKQPGFRVEPWKTLLILDDDEPARRQGPRRVLSALRESKQIEEDELVDKLVAACDVSKPLHEIAHLMRCDLEGVVIPLARELVQNKRAVFIDVVNIRLRTILMPATIVDHLRSITQHAVRFSVAFPKLPALIPLIAMISAAPVPFRDLLPVEARDEPLKRDPWMRAVAWLLRNDLVIQAHVRARVIASGSVKEAAWLKLWHRRRRRWLRERKASVTSASGVSARSRPSFGDGGVGSAGSTSGMAAIFNKATTSTEARAGDKEGSVPPPASGPGTAAWAARVPRTPLAVTRTLSIGDTIDQESEFDVESDDGVDDDGDGDEEGGLAGRWRLLRPPLGPGLERCTANAAYSLDEPEPLKTPTFGASFIFQPAQAQKEEARWLRVVRERTPDPVLRSRFDLCVQYFDGVTTFEEIVFRTGLTRRELDRIAMIYSDDLMISIHP